MRSYSAFAAILFSCLVSMAVVAVPAAAEATGPDAFDVTGVRADDVLNMHADPSARSRTIAKLPAGARGLRNLGCSGAPTFQQWLAMSEAERKRKARGHWCRVEYEGKRGWVSARYLTESSAAPSGVADRTIGPWRLSCAGTCALSQVAVGTRRPVTLRLERAEGANARVIVERAGLPRNGKLSIYMDGETITEGPIQPMYDKAGHRFVMQPDDITLGLVRQMQRHRNMVVSFPGEERGAEVHLDQFAEAWQALAEAKP